RNPITIGYEKYPDFPLYRSRPYVPATYGFDLGDNEAARTVFGKRVLIVDFNRLIPGDWVQIRNHPDYRKKYKTGSFPDDATIYLGERGGKRYFCAGVIGPKKVAQTLEAIQDELAKKYSRRTTRKALPLDAYVRIPSLT